MGGTVLPGDRGVYGTVGGARRARCIETGTRYEAGSIMRIAKVTGIFWIALFAAAVMISDAAGQEVIKGRSKRQESALKQSPLATFKGIENAWVGEDAASLSRFAGEGKVFVNVMGIGQRGGYFSRPQVHYLFKRMFKTYTHTKFNFVKYHNLDKPEGRVYGIAHRSYRNDRNGKIYQDKVYVTLKNDGEVWVVDEIKTTR